MPRRQPRTYRIDFALILLTGNLRRYQIVRPEVDRDTSVRARWYPIRTWFEGDPLSFLPGALRLRVRHLVDSWRFLLLPTADCAVIHAFETNYMYVFIKRVVLRRRVLIVNNPDGTITNSGESGPVSRALWRMSVRHTELFVPWTRAGERRMYVDFPQIEPHRVLPLHPGLDVDKWPFRVQPPRVDGAPWRVLFVGADLKRKGIGVLLAAFDEGLEDCALDVCTSSGYLREEPAFEARLRADPRITLHLDLTPQSPELVELFRTCDVFALPTNGDFIPWVALESLATGIPTIMTPVGAIEEVVRNEETGLIVPCNDAAALTVAIERLRDDPGLGERLRVAGRRLIETEYDAATNTQRLLTELKGRIDLQRARRGSRAETTLRG